MAKKRILQAILAIIGSVAVITGLLGILFGIKDGFYEISFSHNIQGNIILDSNLRYFSGLWMGLGLVIFWVIPSIEQKKSIFRLISGVIFIGGIGRVISIVSMGNPSTPFILFTLLELLFPLLIIWQNKISSSEAGLLAERVGIL
ncbi:MAG: DUF4345 domain-containing protein [Desulfomonile tiedjei]|nr:DUF4345 domain-containing protein [Desulfomonile tiedjei]